MNPFQGDIHFYWAQYLCSEALTTESVTEEDSGRCWRQENGYPHTSLQHCIRTTLDYTIMIWAPELTQTHISTLKRIQNEALRIISGCTNTTPNQHLHAEMKVLPL